MQTRFATPFVPPLGLAGPNAQTIVSSMGRKLIKPRWRQAFQSAAEELTIEVCGVKLVVHLNRASTASAPLIMIIPGWLGDASSTYVLSGAHTFHRHNFNVARIVLRDHGDTAHLNPGLFHSAMIDEVVALVAQLRAMFPGVQAGLIGHSMGGNFALRVARALPDLPTLAVCPAVSPQDTVQAILRSPIYERYFVTKWRKLWRRKEAAYPELYDFSSVMRLSSMLSLTDYFIREQTDFDNAADYYAAYNLTGDGLQGVHAHILASADDPIIPAAMYRQLPDTISVDLIDQGGHGAFLKNWRFDSWGDDYALAFFQHHLLGS